MRTGRLGWLVACAIAAAACGGGDDSSPVETAPATTIHAAGSSGVIAFDVTPDAAVLTGKNVFRVCLTSVTSGAEVDGAALEVTCGMPGMDHASPTPTVAPEAMGCFRVDGVLFGMAGTWMLHVHAKTTMAEDETSVSYDVQ